MKITAQNRTVVAVVVDETHLITESTDDACLMQTTIARDTTIKTGEWTKKYSSLVDYIHDYDGPFSMQLIYMGDPITFDFSE